MGTPIYKISEYVMWDSKSAVLGMGIGGGFTIPPPTPVDTGGDSLWEMVYDSTENTLQPIMDSSGIDVISLPATQIYVGDKDQDNGLLYITARGTAQIVNLKITAESSYEGYGAAGNINIGDSHCFNITLYSTGSTIIVSPGITLGSPGIDHNDTETIIPAENGSGRGCDVILSAGTTYDGNNNHGGNLYLSSGYSWLSGFPPVMGDVGDIYLARKTGSDNGVGILHEAGENDTAVVCYNPTTGKLSYGAGGGTGGDALWQETSGHLEPVTAGEDVYAHDFILLP